MFTKLSKHKKILEGFYFVFIFLFVDFHTVFFKIRIERIVLYNIINNIMRNELNNSLQKKVFLSTNV